MTDAITLLPCPFCGSSVHVRMAYGSGRGHFPEVMCDNPHCEAINPNTDDETEEGVITAWNRRAGGSG